MEPTHPDTQEMAPVHPEQKPTISHEHTLVEDTPEYTTPSLKWGLATLGALIAIVFFILALLSTFEPNPRKTLSFAMFIVATALPVFWFTVHPRPQKRPAAPRTTLEHYLGFCNRTHLFWPGALPCTPVRGTKCRPSQPLPVVRVRDQPRDQQGEKTNPTGSFDNKDGARPEPERYSTP